MTKSNQLSAMTVEELVDSYRDIALAQDDALLEGATTKYNRLYKRLMAVREELKSRQPDERRALRRLYSNSNLQVRLMAAKDTLAISPLEARKQLQTIANAHWLFQSFDAKMCLGLLDDGFFKPN